MGEKVKKAKLVRVELVRQLVADYMNSEGCSCCQNVDAHKEHEKRLAELLDVPAYSDGSGYDFGKFQSRERGGGR